jgi:hypothetical protein
VPAATPSRVATVEMTVAEAPRIRPLVVSVLLAQRRLALTDWPISTMQPSAVEAASARSTRS